MQGRHSYQPKHHCQVSLADFVPDNHPLKRLDKVINVDFIYELTAALYCPDNGRKSIDPVMFFRM